MCGAVQQFGLFVVPVHVSLLFTCACDFCSVILLFFVAFFFYFCICICIASHCTVHSQSHSHTFGFLFGFGFGSIFAFAFSLVFILKNVLIGWWGVVCEVLYNSCFFVCCFCARM